MIEFTYVVYKEQIFHFENAVKQLEKENCKNPEIFIRCNPNKLQKESFKMYDVQCSHGFLLIELGMRFSAMITATNVTK
jgi:hypothetical protein